MYACIWLINTLPLIFRFMEPLVLPDGFRIRQATAADADDIIRLIKALAEYEKELDKVHLHEKKKHDPLP